MSLPVVLTPDARDDVDDVDDARDWYEGQQAGRGDGFLAELHAELQSIEQNPHQHGLVGRKVRAAPLPVSKYVVYYRIEATEVVVNAVLHAGADPRRWQRRR